MVLKPPAGIAPKPVALLVVILLPTAQGVEEGPHPIVEANDFAI